MLNQIFNVFHVPVAVDVAAAAAFVAAVDVAAVADAAADVVDGACFVNAVPVISFALHAGSFERADAAGRVGLHFGFLRLHFDDFWHPMVLAGAHSPGLLLRSADCRD